MRNFLFIMALVTVFSCKNQKDNLKNEDSKSSKIAKNMAGESIYQFKVKDVDGKEFDFETLKGKKIMVVNTASKCGLVGQYQQLQDLYEEFKKDNFVIIAFPSNDFQNQEPLSNTEIATFCKTNYGVSFPIMEKISVKGNEMNPLYQFLTKKSKNGLEDNTVQWNFQKYLINEKGHLDKVIAPQIVPIDGVIIDWIKA
jgi:glutathione peroxidase